MNLIIWLVVGGVIGWLASMVMRTDAQQGVLLNVIVGIIGAVLGGWLISPLIGAGTINQSDFSLAGLIVSFLGAVILLAIVNLFRRGRVRCRASGRYPPICRLSRAAPHVHAARARSPDRNTSWAGPAPSFLGRRHLAARESSRAVFFA